MLLIGLAIVLAEASRAHATLGGPAKDSCPVCGTTVNTWKWASWGPYIYDWPSKYDLVYWPATSENWFWLCTGCGYAQTGRDFSELSEKDVARLKAACEKEWKRPEGNRIPFSLKLERTIRTNRLLGRDEAFWQWFNRVLIYHYRTVDPEKALHYAAEEVELLERERLFPRKETLYLLGEYHRMLGRQSLARRYFSKALAVSVNRRLVLILTTLCLACAFLAALVWRALKGKPAARVFAAVAAVGVAAASFWLYANFKQPNEYYNQVIRDRLALLE